MEKRLLSSAFVAALSISTSIAAKVVLSGSNIHIKTIYQLQLVSGAGVAHVDDYGSVWLLI